MDRSLIIKTVRIFSYVYVLISLLELCLMTLFSTIIGFNFNSQAYSLISLLINPSFTSVHPIFIWVIMFVISAFFLFLGLAILRFEAENHLDNLALVKYHLLIGMFLLIASIVKMEFYFLFAKSEIYNLGLTTSIIEAVLSPTITPDIAVVIWVYFPSVTTAYIFSGCCFSAVSLNSIVKLEKMKK